MPTPSLQKRAAELSQRMDGRYEPFAKHCPQWATSSASRRHTSTSPPLSAWTGHGSHDDGPTARRGEPASVDPPPSQSDF